MNVVNRGTQRSFASRAKARGSKEDKRANRKDGSRESRGEKGTKGSAREARARVARTVPVAKDRGHISRGARGKELGKVCTASAWTSTRRA